MKTINETLAGRSVMAGSTLDLHGTTPTSRGQPADGSTESESEERKFGMIESIALNTLMMFGTGPFITIPFCIASTEPAGPQALMGYAIAAVACLCDSFIWAELGAMFPHSGGSYVYFTECVGLRWGRLMSFLFLWQLLITGPMEVASGFIAIAQYCAYITKTYTYEHHAFIAFAFCVSSIFLLYRDMKEVGKTTVILWIGMCAAIAFTIIAGFTHFDTSNFDMPPVENMGTFIFSLGNAARFGLYDFTGYYDVNFIGKDVQNPTRVIPIACIVTCGVVCIIYFGTCLAVLAYLPWDPAKGGFVSLVLDGDNSAAFIMSIFCERMLGRGFAIFFTLVVIYCIYGSCFSLLLGFAQIPYAAAQNGMFYSIFGHTHRDGFADYGILYMGIASCAFCFVDLAIVIEGMMVTNVCTMFLANSIALVYHRYTQPDYHRPYQMPLYPLPVIFQVAMFAFIFITSDNYVVSGHAPLLEMGMGFLALGTCAFLWQSFSQGKWPFEREGFESDSDSMAGAVSAYTGGMASGNRTAGTYTEMTSYSRKPRSFSLQAIPARFEESADPRKVRAGRPRSYSTASYMVGVPRRCGGVYRVPRGVDL